MALSFGTIFPQPHNIRIPTNKCSCACRAMYYAADQLLSVLLRITMLCFSTQGESWGISTADNTPTRDKTWTVFVNHNRIRFETFLILVSNMDQQILTKPSAWPVIDQIKGENTLKLSSDQWHCVHLQSWGFLWSVGQSCQTLVLFVYVNSQLTLKYQLRKAKQRKWPERSWPFSRGHVRSEGQGSRGEIQRFSLLVSTSKPVRKSNCRGKTSSLQTQPAHCHVAKGSEWEVNLCDTTKFKNPKTQQTFFYSHS